MYEIIEEDSLLLNEKNLFYKGDTSIIYKKDNYLYKIYLKKEPHKRKILDYLIENNDNINTISVPPIKKIKYKDNYGMKMNYIEGYDFYDYVKKINNYEFINILTILSKNLRKLNSYNIKLTDLHHHNILIKTDGYPIYIDIDDANVCEIGSTHLSEKSYYLHSINLKDYEFEDNLLKYGNLDRECLFLFFLRYCNNQSIERLSYYDYNNYINKIEKFLDKNFIKAIRELKPYEYSKNINIFPYYIDSFLEDKDKISYGIEKIKVMNK